MEVSECLDCGATVRARLPNARAPAGYGPQLQSEIVLGKIEERLPYRKLEERLARDGIPSCPATLQAVVWNAAEKLKDEEAAIVARLRAAPWVHADESSYRIDGRKVWIWTFGTDRDLLLVIRPSRGRQVVEEVLGKDYGGQIVCDGWAGYLGWELQRCWAHLLRMAKARAEEGPTARELYGALCDVYRAADDGSREREPTDAGPTGGDGRTCPRRTGSAVRPELGARSSPGDDVLEERSTVVADVPEAPGDGGDEQPRRTGTAGGDRDPEDYRDAAQLVGGGGVHEDAERARHLEASRRESVDEALRGAQLTLASIEAEHVLGSFRE